jgi:hypothetical protein
MLSQAVAQLLVLFDVGPFLLKRQSSATVSAIFAATLALSAVPPGGFIPCGLTLHLASKHAPTNNYIG